MLANLFLPFVVLIGITAWIAGLHVVRVEQARLQQEIANRGACCEGRVVAIQRPFLLDTSTRFYFDFVPPGAARSLRGCHITRPSNERRATDMPCEGALITVRYLPERPHDAVIGKLIH